MRCLRSSGWSSLLEGRPAIDLIAIRNTRQIVLFKPHLHPREPGADICEGIGRIRRLLEEKQIAPLRIAVGKVYSGIGGLIASYRSAQDTMRAGQAIFPEQPVYYSEDMPNETAAANVKPSWIGGRAAAAMAAVRAGGQERGTAADAAGLL
ncbi:hypothetical protein [Paenibacillus thiaminolyticus]|uniref:hypothetical protein n=1 Tax=Paenibacillus thiaminolyticus TaxID=49283 RepID=UPI003B984425